MLMIVLVSIAFFTLGCVLGYRYQSISSDQEWITYNRHIFDHPTDLFLGHLPCPRCGINAYVHCELQDPPSRVMRCRNCGKTEHLENLS